MSVNEQELTKQYCGKPFSLSFNVVKNTSCVKTELLRTVTKDG